MGVKLKFMYIDMRDCMDILYSSFHINCYTVFNAINIDKPAILVSIAMDTPPEHDPIIIELKNVDEKSKYLIDIAKKLFEYITNNDEKIVEGEENEAEVDIDPNIVQKIENIEVYNISEYDYALLFVFNLV